MAVVERIVNTSGKRYCIKKNARNSLWVKAGVNREDKFEDMTYMTRSEAIKLAAAILEVASELAKE